MNKKNQFNVLLSRTTAKKKNGIIILIAVLSHEDVQKPKQL